MQVDEPDLDRPPFDELEQGGVINDRMCVRQGGYGRHAAGRCCLLHRGEGLHVLFAGLTHLDPHIHQTRGEAASAAINHVDIGRRGVDEQLRAEIQDPLTLGQDRTPLIKPGGRVQQAGILVENGSHAVVLHAAPAA